MDKDSIYLISQILIRNGWINLPADGDSMFPFIQKGDIGRFIICDPTSLNKGDIVLFQSANAQLVAHRLYQVISVNNQKKYQFKGDTNLGLDEPVGPEQIIGKLTCIQKKRITFSATNRVVRVWGKIILSFPVLSSLLRRYLNMKQKDWFGVTK